MEAERFEQVRLYLSTWSEADWDDLYDQLAVMGLPDALVAVHRRKVSEFPRLSAERTLHFSQPAANREPGLGEQLDLFRS